MHSEVNGEANTFTFNVTRSAKLWGAQRSPELALRSTNFRSPENLIFPALWDGVVDFCKWNENSIVNIGSNFLSHLPIETVIRRVKSEPDARITQHQLIKQYNNGMGGVDVIDRLLGSYRPNDTWQNMVLTINHKCHQCFCGCCLAVTLCCGRNTKDSFRVSTWNCCLSSEISNGCT